MILAAPSVCSRSVLGSLCCKKGISLLLRPLNKREPGSPPLGLGLSKVAVEALFPKAEPDTHIRIVLNEGVPLVFRSFADFNFKLYIRLG